MRHAPMSLVLLLSLAPATVDAAPILINGSFEQGPPPFTSHDIGIPAGSTDVTGWMILGGGVDLLEDPWDVSDGERAIDLDFRSPGGVEQTFGTAPGQKYVLSFDLSGNPEGGALLKELQVAAGNALQDYSFDSTGQTL